MADVSRFDSRDPVVALSTAVVRFSTPFYHPLFLLPTDLLRCWPVLAEQIQPCYAAIRVRSTKSHYLWLRKRMGRGPRTIRGITGTRLPTEGGSRQGSIGRHQRALPCERPQDSCVREGTIAFVARTGQD